MAVKGMLGFLATCKKHKVGFVLFAGGQFESIKVCIGDANVLRLALIISSELSLQRSCSISETHTPTIRAHGDIAWQQFSRRSHDSIFDVLPYAPPANPGLTPVQNAVFPSSQLRQRPSATLNGITTRSPFLSSVMPSPSSSTIPMFSWPVPV